mgnify:CR=1 FL=1
MRKTRFEKQMQRQLNLAGAFGVLPPVLATLSPDSTPAVAMYAALYREHLRPGEGDYHEHHGRLVTWSVGGATRLLRAHGGLAGRLAANLLEKPPVRPDVWWLQIDPDAIGPSAFRGEEMVARSYALIDRPPFASCPRWTFARPQVQVGEPALGVGEAVARSPNGTPAGRASALAHIAARRSVPSASPAGATELTALPVGDDELALILRDYYCDAPEVVAAALGDLDDRGLGGGWWLTRTMRVYPELRGLGERVKRLRG